MQRAQRSIKKEQPHAALLWSRGFLFSCLKYAIAPPPGAAKKSPIPGASPKRFDAGVYDAQISRGVF